MIVHPFTPPRESEEPTPSTEQEAKPESPGAREGFVELDAVRSQFSQGVDDIEQEVDALSDGSEGTVRKVEAGLNAVLGAISMPMDLLDSGFAVAADALNIKPPGMPAATLGSMHVGLPHMHTHPPSSFVPLPSIGAVQASGDWSVVINGQPAARAGDLGAAPTCGGFGSIFEVFTGSSSVFVGGSRCARVSDFTQVCFPPNPAAKAKKAMQKAAYAVQAASAVAQGLKLWQAVANSEGGNGVSPEAAAMAVATQAKQAAADIAHGVMSMLMGMDPGIPPAVGGLVTGSPNVLVGGLPMPDSMVMFGAMSGLAKRALKGVGSLAQKKRLSLGENRRTPKEKIEASNACMDPVSPVSGVMFRDLLDARLDPEIGWTWKRYYRSDWAGTPGCLGKGMRHEYERRLGLQPNRARFEDYDGTVIELDRDDHGGWLVYGGYSLWEDLDGTFTLDTPEGGVSYRFELCAVCEGNGHRTRTRFDEDQYWPVQQARLIEVVDPSKGRLRMEYSQGGTLIGLVDDAHGVQVSLEWSSAARWLYGVHRVNASGENLCLASYTFNTEGSLTRFAQALKGKVEYRYDPKGRMVRAQHEGGYGFTWRYDEQGRCVETSGDDGSLSGTFVYTKGETKVTARDGGVWTYRYNDEGLITEVIDPEGGTSSYLQDAQGVVTSQRDARGIQTKWLYDDEGHHYARKDVFGNLVPPEHIEPFPQSSRGLPEHSSLRSIATGKADNESRIDEPASSPKALGVPASLTAVAEDLFAFSFQDRSETILKANDFGEWTERLDLYGRYHQRSFTPYGEVEAWQRAGQPPECLEYGHAWRVPDVHIDALGRRTQYRYDHRQDIIAITDPSGFQTRYERNLAGHITAVYDEDGLLDRYDCDEAGRVVATCDRHQQTLVEYTYGPHGECETRTQHTGEVHHYRYNAQGMMTEASSATTKVELGYDHDNQVRYDLRDGLGIVHHKLTGKSYQTTLLDRYTVRYEVSYNETLIHLPNGKQTVLKWHQGGCVERRTASGLCELSQYDDLGQCRARLMWCGQDEQTWERWRVQYHHHNSDGTLYKVEDSQSPHPVHYDHDALGRVGAMRYGDDPWVLYTYSQGGDLAGNGLYHELYSTPNHQLQFAYPKDRGPTERFTYDHRQRLHTWTRDGVTQTFHYNGVDRLIQVEWSDGRPNWEAEYDGMGRRLWKRNAQGQTDYYWEDDRLAAEARPSGLLRVYIYPGLKALVPIAFIDYNDRDLPEDEGKLYSVHCDHLGMASHIRDAEGEVVWRATKVDAYGTILEHEDPENLNWTLRWPGHEYDEATGLHYNRFRYFSPRLGRYLRADPLGQAGGINVFAYPCSPTRMVDVYGLECPAAKKKRLERERMEAKRRSSGEGPKRYMEAPVGRRQVESRKTSRDARKSAPSDGSIRSYGEFKRVTEGIYPDAKHSRAAWRVYREANTTDRVLVVGRLDDTKAASGEGGRRLNTDPWSPEINDAWVQGAIDAGRPIKLVSAVKKGNLIKPPPTRYPETVMYRELKQLRAAGYRIAEGWALPPI